jgi:predicted PurR-regulated permease PerM
MTRQHLFAAFFFAVFLFLLYQFYQMFSMFIAPLTWSALLAFIFYPLYTQLTRWLRGRAGLASFLLTTMVILAVMVPTVLLIILLANESAALYQSSVEFLNGPGLREALGRVRASTPARAWTLWTTILHDWNIDLADIAAKGTNEVSAFLVSQAAGILKNIASFIVDFFLTTFALFFFFRDGARMVRGLRDLLPMETVHKDTVLQRLHETLSAVVQGTLITAAAQGALAGVGFAALGVPFAVFLGCAAAFASLLPFGAPLDCENHHPDRLGDLGRRHDRQLRPSAAHRRQHRDPDDSAVLRHSRRAASLRLSRSLPGPRGDRHPGGVRAHLPRAVRQRLANGFRVSRRS